MALVTPIVNDIPALDATKANFISFIANGGDQIIKNEIKILLNDDTETVVYSHTQTTDVLGQTIPANTLTNGIYYKVAFKTYNSLGDSSEWSNYQPFHCYTAPTLSFNISNGQVIHSSSFDLKLTYNQAQDERLQSAVIYFYDGDDNLISSSGNLFNTNIPPVVFDYTLRGFDNNKIYKIKADGYTVNNTPLTTGTIIFYVNYQTIASEGEIYLTVDSCNGYINVKSSPISNTNLGNVTNNPSDLTYYITSSETTVDLTSVVGKIDLADSYSYWVKWYNIYAVSNAFLFRLWFYPARTSFKVAELVAEDNSNHIVITYNRGETQDYISIRTDDGTSIDSPLDGICNGNTKVFLWLKVVNGDWDVQTEILSNTTTVLDWNTDNNINYNISTDVKYGNESYGSFIPSSNVENPLSGHFDTVIIGNGIFDELNLSLNVNLPYTHEVPTEDMSAVLFVHFDGNVVNRIYNNYTKAVIQRKDEKTSTWWNVATMDIPNNTSVEIEYNDYFIPSGIKQTYGLIVYQGNLFSNSYTLEVVPKWGRVFISDRDENYKLNYAVVYSNGTQNIQNGVLMPIGATYPIVIENAEGNYRSGSLQFKVLGYQFEIDKTLDRNSIVKQTEDIIAFLTNKKPKCIKDYNGNIYICKVINSPQISYDANWGNGISTISFDWVEQTKYDDYDGMTEFGLIDTIVS